MAEVEERPSPRAVLDNWLQPMPLGRKAALAIRNITARLRGQRCCGHPGEPGC